MILRLRVLSVLPLATAFGLALGLATVLPPAAAAEPARNEGRTVEFSAEASKAAANDLAVATLYAEHSGASPAEVASEVNRRIAAALETARAQKDIKVQTGAASTWPVYDKDGAGRIEAWRMRAEIRLESANIGAMSELIGVLQRDLALGQLAMQPAPETRRKAFDEATVDAIRAFEARARLVAGTLGREYRIRHLSIGDSGGFQPVYPRAASMMKMDAAAPAALEGGESQVSVNVSGRIELLD